MQKNVDKQMNGKYIKESDINSHQGNLDQNHNQSWMWRHTPISTWETEAEGSSVRGQPGLYSNTLSQNKTKTKTTHQDGLASESYKTVLLITEASYTTDGNVKCCNSSENSSSKVTHNSTLRYIPKKKKSLYVPIKSCKQMFVQCYLQWKRSGKTPNIH